MIDQKNLYEILEIPNSANQEQIYQAYMRMKNSYSGDNLALYSLISEDEGKKILSSIEEAYTVLSIPERRREYDRNKGIQQSYASMSSASGMDYQSSLTDQTLNNQTPPNTGEQFDHQINEPVNHYLKSEHEQKEEESRFTLYKQNDHSKVSKIAATNRFSLSFEPNSEMEQKIENCTEFTGKFLSEIREYKNVTLEKMSDMTKISKTHLKYIEADQIENLPAAPYVRGFIYQYARMLKLDPDIIANSYMAFFKSRK